MKRVRSACICQTLVFAQKEDANLSKEYALELNGNEFEKYKEALQKARTKYVVVDYLEESDGSIVVKIKKQYNDKCDVSEYF